MESKNTTTYKQNISSNGSDSISSFDKNEEIKPLSFANNNNSTNPIKSTKGTLPAGKDRKQFHSSAYLFDSNKSNNLSISPVPVSVSVPVQVPVEVSVPITKKK